MYTASLLGFFILSGSLPQQLDQPLHETEIAQQRSFAACTDAFLQSRSSDALISYAARRSPLRKLNKYAAEEVNAEEEAAALAELKACTGPSKRATKASNAAMAYVETALVERALLKGLQVRGVNIATLSSLEFDSIYAAMQRSKEDTQKLLEEAGFPLEHFDLLIGYAFLHKTNKTFFEIWHPPANPARRVSGSIMSSDYPSGAFPHRAESILSIHVSRTGSVVGCDPFIPSGVAVLDATACRLISERFQYEPARDESGEAVSQIVVQKVVWRK